MILVLNSLHSNILYILDVEDSLVSANQNNNTDSDDRQSKLIFKLIYM